MGLVEDKKNGVVRQSTATSAEERAKQEQKAKAAREKAAKEEAARVAKDQKEERETKGK